MGHYSSLGDLPPDLMEALRDQFRVQELSYEQRVDDLGKSPGPFSPSQARTLARRLLAHANAAPDLHTLRHEANHGSYQA